MSRVFLPVFILSAVMWSITPAQAAYRTWGMQTSEVHPAKRYLTLKGIMSDVDISNIENGLLYDQVWLTRWDRLKPSKTGASDQVMGGSIAIGYVWDFYGNYAWRTEFEATTRGHVKYEVSPIYMGEPDALAGIASSLKGSALLKNYMLNIYYDFNGSEKPMAAFQWTPYVGLGLGVAVNRTTFTFFDNLSDPIFVPLSSPKQKTRESSFSWAGMIGFAYGLTENVKFDVNARYIDLGEVRWGIKEPLAGEQELLKSEDVTATEIQAGLRFHF